MLTLLWAAVSLSTMDPTWNRDDPPDARLQGLSTEIYRLLADNPDGLDIKEIRQRLGIGDAQQHLDRRLRDLRKYYDVPGQHKGNRFVYVLKGPKSGKIGDTGAISGKLRAAVLHAAKGRCQMCGKTVQEDGIRLQIDHKIPQAWGGLSTAENLWAICESCNNGKRDYFASFDIAEMKDIVALPSVHERVARLLKANMGKPVASRLIEFVANATERQEDWHKRLRELRYPPIGLVINVGKRKNPEGYIESTYTLENWIELPAEHKKLIREWDSRKKSGDED
jgi:5-methylcytosine-specific restriction endonuclease McrA